MAAADVAGSYIDGVMSGEIVAGRRLRQAVERHLHDLDSAGDRGHFFDAETASVAVDWFPLALQHVRGEWAGDPMELTPSQAFIVWMLFGWRRADGTRRFRHVYITCGRKWGKSTFAAALGLLLLTFDDPYEPGAQIYCAATKEDQARLVHDVARAMAEQSPVLQNQTKVLRKAIVTKPGSYQPHSYFVPLGSDSRTSDGFDPHGVVLDEIHEWKEQHQGLYDKLTTAHGSRRQPVIVTITTAGDDRSELWNEVDALCCHVLDNFTSDDPPGDNRLVFIARLDDARACDCPPDDRSGCERCGGTGQIDADDPFDERNWPKANPNYPITPKPDFLREQAADAKVSPKAAHAFKRYHMNIRVSALDRAIDPVVWSRATGELSDWSDADAIGGGWDMGGQDDLSAIGLCARFNTGQPERNMKGELTGRPLYRYEVDARAFLNTSADRDVTKPPWSSWVSDGLLTVHPFEVGEMRSEIIRWFRERSVKRWAYDPHNGKDFAQGLETDGIEAVKFYQNAAMWTEPLTGFTRALAMGNVTHPGNGLLTYAAKNMILVNVSRAGSTLTMPDKRASTDKIDPIVSVIMAFRIAAMAPTRAAGRVFIS